MPGLKIAQADGELRFLGAKGLQFCVPGASKLDS